MDKKPDTITGRVNEHLVGPRTPIPHEIPQQRIITEENSQQTESTQLTGESNQESLMILSVSLIPVLALLILPVAAKDVITPKEKLIQEEQYSLITSKRTI